MGGFRLTPLYLWIEECIFDLHASSWRGENMLMLLAGQIAAQFFPARVAAFGVMSTFGVRAAARIGLLSLNQLA